jgi:hypothetical protein
MVEPLFKEALRYHWTMTGGRLNDCSMMKGRNSIVTAGTTDLIGSTVATTSPRKPTSAAFRATNTVLANKLRAPLKAQIGAYSATQNRETRP